MVTYSIPQLLDFVQATGEGYLDRPQAFQNDASLNTYFWGRMINGLGDKLYVNGGQNIRRPIIFKGNGTFREYKTGPRSTPWSDNQLIQKLTAYLRFTETHMTFRDQEILLNDGSGGDNVFHQFVNLRDSKVAGMKVAQWNGLEGQLFAVPDKTLMEGEGATQISPYSIFAFINEFANGLFAQGPGGTWTTIEGLSPTDASTNGQWKCIQETYTQDTIAYDSPFEAFDRIVNRLDWQLPTSDQQYFADPAMQKLWCLCSNLGSAALRFLNRSGQDKWTRFGDAGVREVTHGGIGFHYASQLDTAAVWDTGSGLGTEAQADNSGPRFLFVNGNYMHPVCHAERFFWMDDPMRDRDDPEAWVIVNRVWWQLVCTSLRHQGIVFPNADGMFVAAS